MSKPSDRIGLGSLATGAVTAVALAVQTGLAAVVGVIIAREFGRSAETDGFFASYGVFIVLALAATSLRIVVLPELARARAERRLAAETGGWAAAASLVMLPVLVIAVLLTAPVAALLTGLGPDAARAAAEETLPWMVVAALAHVYAGLGASALAALDDYVTAAAGYITASVVGLAYILLRLDDGIEAVSVGMALNGVLAAVIPALALAWRARREAMAPSAARPAGGGLRGRLSVAAQGIALPLALQAVYLVSLPVAAREGVGYVTTFGYAYLAGSAVVAVCASSLGLVTAVPLTRLRLTAAEIARHVTASSWIALVAVGLTATVALLAGSPLVSAVLGESYLGAAGDELGRTIAAFSPWMVAAVGFAVTLPVVFVADRARALPVVALLALAVHAVLLLPAQLAFGVGGLALLLAVSTTVALAGALHALGAARATLLALARAALVVALVALVSVAVGYALPDGGLAGAVAGGVFLGIVLLVRPAGLRDAWAYLRRLA